MPLENKEFKVTSISFGISQTNLKKRRFFLGLPVCNLVKCVHFKERRKERSKNYKTYMIGISSKKGYFSTRKVRVGIMSD